MHLLARFQSSPIQQLVTYRFRTFSHFLQFENLQICFRVFSKWRVPVRVYYRMNIVRCIIFQGSEKDRVKEIKARFVCQWIFNRCWSHVEIQYKKKYKICCTIFYPPRRYNFFFFQSFFLRETELYADILYERRGIEFTISTILFAKYFGRRVARTLSFGYIPWIQRNE